MKYGVILAIIAVFGLLVGCSSTPAVTEEASNIQHAVGENPTPEQDLLVKLLANGKKQDGYFTKVVASLMVNGSIDKQVVDCKLIAHQFEYCNETWYLTDAGNNHHLVTIENGKITGVAEGETPESNLPSPAGGWRH
jgi:hypothetical protein